MLKQTWFFIMALIPVVVGALAIGNVDGWAQGATPVPFNKVTVSADVAKRTLMKAVINADAARAIVDACVEWQKAQPGNGRRRSCGLDTVMSRGAACSGGLVSFHLRASWPSNFR